MPRTVGRVNHPNNEWLFTEAWGVDVNVSTPRIMSALVEEAVTVGDLVRLFTFRQGNANLVEMTLPPDSPYVGKPSGLIPFPENCALVTILRDGQVYTPDGGAAGRGRRRAAVRRPGRRRGGARAAPRAARTTAAEPPPAQAAGRARLGDPACGCAPAATPSPPSAASWSGQPSAILSTPRAATAVSASIEPRVPASQTGACSGDPHAGRAAPAAR